MRDWSHQIPGQRSGTAAAGSPPASAASRPHSIARERLIGGAAAATFVLGWFALVDGVSAGSPWVTAEHIGAPLAALITGTAPAFWASIGAFLVFHYALWIGAASLVLSVVHRGERNPMILVPAVLVAVVVQLPLIVLTTVLVQRGWGSGLWIRLMLGELIGGVIVAANAYLTHPDLVRYELAHMSDDGD